MRCWLRTKTVWWCTLIKVNRHLNRQFRSEHTRWQFAITCRGDTCVLDDFCENLCRCNMSQKIQIRQNLCDLLRRQNSVAEKIFHQKISCTHEATCPCDASPQLVGTTTRPTCTQSDLSPRLVAATHRLVCFDLYALLGPVYIEVGDPR